MEASGESVGHASTEAALIQGADRTRLWLPLLQRLTAVVPSWVVWKNLDSALYGIGDIDAAADPSSWGTIQHEFCDWALSRGLGPVIVCPHIPSTLDLVAVPQDSTTLLEVGVKVAKVWRGSILFVRRDLERLTTMDARGFRKLRPGAEGFFKLLLNGTRWDGTPNHDSLRDKHVAELLSSDLAGAQFAAELLGPTAAAGIAAARAAAAGRWHRGAMLVVQGWAVARGLARPHVMAKRAWFRVAAQKNCPVLAALLGNHRRIPHDRERWLKAVAAGHQVFGSLV